MATKRMLNLPIPIVGQSYRDRAAQVSNQTTKNIYPKIDRNGQSISLQGWPGLKLWTTLTDTAAVRGLGTMQKTLYSVSGTTLAEIDEEKNETTYTGEIPGEEALTITNDGTNLIISTSIAQYTATAGGGAVTQISAAGVSNSAGFMDRRIIYQQSSGRFASADVGDPSTVNGLNFATAESFPDDIERLFTYQKYMWLFGSESAEPWFFNGSGSPPYVVNRNGVIRYGSAGRLSVGEISDYIYFLDQWRRPQRILGLQVPEFIGNSALGAEWRSYDKVDDCQIYTLSFDHQDFVIYIFPLAQKTWGYHVESGWWFELGTEGRYLMSSQARVYNKNLVGDFHQTGKIFELDFDTFTEDGNTVIRQRDSALIDGALYQMPGKRLTLNRLELVFEAGVGLTTGQGSDPEVMVRISKDGGRTFGNEMIGKLGVSGSDRLRVEFNALGQYKDFVIRVTMSDPVQFALISANADIDFDD